MKPDHLPLSSSASIGQLLQSAVSLMTPHQLTRGLVHLVTVSWSKLAE